MTRVEIIFPDLNEEQAVDAADAIAGALANDVDLRLLLDHERLPRKFEVKLNDAALPLIDGQTYEVTNGCPGHVTLTDSGGHH